MNYLEVNLQYSQYLIWNLKSNKMSCKFSEFEEKNEVY